MAKSKIQRGFYPISYSDLKRMVGYCENWGYGNKDTCKYVAENTIERIVLNYPELPIRDTLYGELIELVHDMNNGRQFVGELKISIK